MILTTEYGGVSEREQHGDFGGLVVAKTRPNGTFSRGASITEPAWLWAEFRPRHHQKLDDFRWFENHLDFKGGIA